MFKYLSKTIRQPFSMIRSAIRKNNIINPHIKMFRIKIENKKGTLEEIMKRLSVLDLDYSCVESSFILKEPGHVHFDVFFEEFSKEVNKTEIEECLEGMDAIVNHFGEILMPSFPIKLEDLDNMGIVLQDPDDGLNQDHPGFTDKEYLERRNMIGESGKGYKMLDPISRIDYVKQETDLWEMIYTKLRPELIEHGCTPYVENLHRLEEDGIFSEKFIPQLDDINAYLNKRTNWRIKPVNGILSQREYLNCLAFRTFPSTQYIRHHSVPFYTPEPDIVHEFIGHIPNFCDPIFCDISQQIGILSLGASDQMVKLIGSVYWFTIEFGLCKENDKMKFYGAGVASSLDELKNFQNTDKIYKLDLEKEHPPLDFVVQDVQPFYYYIDRFEDYLEQLNLLGTQMRKKFNYNFDSESKNMFIDRRIRVFDP